ncbi:AraC family transcriptional regulator [Shewanella sp. UCD-KL12]|uniref:AraC family transcriptional regulator n=1 Tax=Shewanella sp. UCD-KL12 TaxID=1917163 RepID=UPI0009709212|nr:AraC family transcriptional regulator [Shewanella sp. UCD-KL12]
MTTDSPLSRIEKVLEYIHGHLDQTLSLEELAAQSCWSRWQLQRVFQSHTGQSVAQYVRELKLSLAAERVLAGKERMLDIAYELGFNSEVSFSRAFKQFFGASPREYKLRGLRVGLRNPLAKLSGDVEAHALNTAFLQTRIEHKPAFELYGVSSPFKGLLSDAPDFATIVPETWQRFHHEVGGLDISSADLIGVVDTHIQLADESQLNYWAGFERSACHEGSNIEVIEFDRLSIPSQEYAVVSYEGEVSGFGHIVEWLICHWLPDSAYLGVEGFELEHYGKALKLDNDQPRSLMEYWLPVKKKL